MHCVKETALSFLIVLLFSKRSFAFHIANVGGGEARTKQIQVVTLYSTVTRKQSWSIVDDWNYLSSENPQNGIHSNDLYNQDLATKIAAEMEQSCANDEINPQDTWLNDAIDTIQDEKEASDRESIAATALSNTEAASLSFMSAMDSEIALLIRCNELPHELLIRQGRALPPLSDKERYHVGQLVQPTPQGFQATPFLKESVSTIFTTHAKAVARDGSSDLLLDSAGVASWLRRCLNDRSTIGPHDRRVTSLLSKYAIYGTGRLTRDGLERLYVDAIVGDKNGTALATATAISALNQLQRFRQTAIQSVWRDLRNHNILSPVQVERTELEQKMQQNLQNDQAAVDLQSASSDLLFDECEIVYHDDSDSPTNSRKRKMSHELVELAEDGKTPLWIKDGQFVFIDEESCIGCTQCVLAAPASFQMTSYDGRGRTFAQRNNPEVAMAVSSCPVDCMHYVSYRELKEFETARDHGDGRQDHRHFGQSEERGYMGRAPLHVSGRDSDANHKSSWYHYLRNKCFTSSSCPQKGCYDCPAYRTKGSNPNFQANLRKATHTRAQYFQVHGHADGLTKSADL